MHSVTRAISVEFFLNFEQLKLKNKARVLGTALVDIVELVTG